MFGFFKKKQAAKPQVLRKIYEIPIDKVEEFCRLQGIYEQSESYCADETDARIVKARFDFWHFVWTQCLNGQFNYNDLPFGSSYKVDFDKYTPRIVVTIPVADKEECGFYQGQGLAL